MITEEDVYHFLEQDGPARVSRITGHFMIGRGKCSECGKTTDEYAQKQAEVKEALLSLLNDSRVASTPDWSYKVVK